MKNRLQLFVMIAMISIFTSPSFADGVNQSKALPKSEISSLTNKSPNKGWTFTIEQLAGPKETIQFINTESTYKKTDKNKPMANLFGRVSSDLSIFYNNEIISNKDSVTSENLQKINFNVPLESNSGSFYGKFTLTSLDSKGETNTFKYIVRYQLNRSDRRSGFRIGTDITNVSYRQSNLESYGSTFITIKGGATYCLNNSLSLNSDLSFDLLPISVRSEQTLRFLKFNLNGEWELPIKSRDWKFSTKAGAYYQTTFSSNGNIGFRNMLGPEFYLKIKRLLLNDRYVSSYLKYSLVPNDSSWLSLGNKELELGMSYNFLIKNIPTSLNSSVGITNVSGLSSSNSINYTTISGGISLGF